MDNISLKYKLNWVIDQLKMGLNDDVEEQSVPEPNKYAYKYGWCSNAVESALEDLDEIIKIIDSEQTEKTNKHIRHKK